MSHDVLRTGIVEATHVYETLYPSNKVEFLAINVSEISFSVIVLFTIFVEFTELSASSLLVTALGPISADVTELSSILVPLILPQVILLPLIFVTCDPLPRRFVALIVPVTSSV
jgi:hypothetical protein